MKSQDETSYTPVVGRKPILSEDQETLQKYVVKIHPKLWERLGLLVGQRKRSAEIRRLIEDRVKSLESEG